MSLRDRDRDETPSTPYTALCRHCPLEVTVQNQPALDAVMDVLDGSDACRHSDSGHDMKQVFPPA